LSRFPIFGFYLDLSISLLFSSVFSDFLGTGNPLSILSAEKILCFQYFCCRFRAPFGLVFLCVPLSSARKESNFMQLSTLKVSAVVLGAIVALSAVKASAIPMGPFPGTGGKVVLSAIPMGPFPGTGGNLVSAIPMGPFPGTGGKLVSAIPMGPFPGTGGKLVSAIPMGPFPGTGGKART
jgi:hypothetical protein